VVAEETQDQEAETDAIRRDLPVDIVPRARAARSLTQRMLLALTQRRATQKAPENLRPASQKKRSTSLIPEKRHLHLRPSQATLKKATQGQAQGRSPNPAGLNRPLGSLIILI